MPNKIDIDILNARTANKRLPAVNSKTAAVKSGNASLSRSVDPAIQDLRGIKGRLKKTSGESSDIERRIKILYNALDSFLDKYEKNEASLLKLAEIDKILGAVSSNAAMFDIPKKNDLKEAIKKLIEQIKNQWVSSVKIGVATICPYIYLAVFKSKVLDYFWNKIDSTIVVTQTGDIVTSAVLSPVNDNEKIESSASLNDLNQSETSFIAVNNEKNNEIINYLNRLDNPTGLGKLTLESEQNILTKLREYREWYIGLAPGNINIYQDTITKLIERITKTEEEIANKTEEGIDDLIFSSPFPGKFLNITSDYGWRTVEPKWHTAIDIGFIEGTPINAAKPGKVIFSGWYNTNNHNAGYGQYIIIQHNDDTQTLYAHCSELLVTEGQEVYKNTVIGKVGSTGNSHGNHLHFEVRLEDENGKYTSDGHNPMDYIDFGIEGINYKYTWK